MELTDKKEWKVTLDGISCRIVFWSTENMRKPEYSDIYKHKGIWNSYIYLDSKSFPESFKKLLPKKYKLDMGNSSRKIWSTSNYPISMAYGITYAEAVRDTDGKIVGFEIGNDYNHYWNDEQYISEETILHDLKETVEIIKQLYPDRLVYSHMDGSYVSPNKINAHNKKVHAKLFPKKKRV